MSRNETAQKSWEQQFGRGFNPRAYGHGAGITGWDPKSQWSGNPWDFANEAMSRMDEFGNTPGLPHRYVAPDMQHLANMKAMQRNDRLMQEGYGNLQGRYEEGRMALQSGLGNLQTYRPGGMAALLSPYYQAQNASLMREGDMGLQTAAMRRQEAPDLMFRFDQTMRQKAQERARRADLIGTIGQGVGLAGGIAATIATGGAAAPLLALQAGNMMAGAAGGQAYQGQDVPNTGGVPSASGGLPGTATAPNPFGLPGTGAPSAEPPPNYGTASAGGGAGAPAPGGGGPQQGAPGGGAAGGGTGRSFDPGGQVQQNVGGPTGGSPRASGGTMSRAEFDQGQQQMMLGGMSASPRVNALAARAGAPPELMEGALRATVSESDRTLTFDDWAYFNDRLFDLIGSDRAPLYDFPGTGHREISTMGYR